VKNAERNKSYIIVEHVADFKVEENALQGGRKTTDTQFI
jgi:hypothetical protein